MCFTTTNNTKKIAQEDIICYKWAFFEGPDTWRSEYCNKIYKTGETYRAKSGIPFGRAVSDIFKFPILSLTVQKVTYEFGTAFRIHAGIHSYKNKSNSNIRCCIPKGTEYYENNSEYVSLKIRIIGPR